MLRQLRWSMLNFATSAIVPLALTITSDLPVGDRVGAFSIVLNLTECVSDWGSIILVIASHLPKTKEPA
jgi:hypothetical protein